MTFTDRLQDVVLLRDDDELERLPRALHHVDDRRVGQPHRGLAVHVHDAVACNKDGDII